MIDRFLRYLRENAISFRFSSHPSPEAMPAASDPLFHGAMQVETHVFLAGGMPILACTPRGAEVSLSRLEHELGVAVREGSSADLPPPFTGTNGPIPPLGGAMGLPVVLDESITTAPAVCFEVFSSVDELELPFDQLALLERPRVASFVLGGELPEHLEEARP